MEKLMKCRDNSTAICSASEDDEMIDRMMREYIEAKKKNKSDKKEKTATESVNSKEKDSFKKSYECTQKDIFLTVRDRKNKSYFAYLEEGAIKFSENIQKDGMIVYPQDIFTKEGEYFPLVGVPLKEMMEKSEHLDIDSIYNKIVSHINKYIDMPEADVEMFAYYIIFTWFYKKVNTLPYLRFLGDTGKGKTRLLRVISDLIFYPLHASGGSTASGIIRYNEKWHGTLTMNEADIKGGSENELVTYINEGFEKGGFVLKTNPSDVSNQHVLDAFCPKIFAMRKPFQDNATEGRLISFSPKETTRKDIPVNLPPVYEKEVDELRGMIAKFVIFNWKNVDGNNLYEYRNLPIEARLKQMIAPMSLIFQLMPEGEKRFKNYVLQRQKDLKEVRSLSKEGEAFNQLYSLAIREEKVPEEYEIFCLENGNLSEIPPTMMSLLLDEHVARTTKILSSIGVSVENNNVPINTGKTKKTRRYIFKNGDAWREAFQRYYFSDVEEDMDTIPDCPEVLRSQKYTDISITS